MLNEALKRRGFRSVVRRIENPSGFSPRGTLLVS